MKYTDNQNNTFQDSEQVIKSRHRKTAHRRVDDSESLIDLDYDIRTSKNDSQLELLKYAKKQSQLQDDSSKKNKKHNSHMLQVLNSSYRGCLVTVLIQGIGVISGEVVFNFDSILALKHESTIVFINSEMIVAFY